MSDLTQILAEIKARADKATPGPWFVNYRMTVPAELRAHPDHSKHDKIYSVSGLNWAVRNPPQNLAEDWEFIAHARTDIPCLVAALEKAITVLDACRYVVGPGKYHDDLEWVKANIAPMTDGALASIEAILKGEK